MEQGAWAAMADPGTLDASVGPGIQAAMVGPPPWPLRLEPYYPPPKKHELGKVGALPGWCSGGAGTWGRSGNADTWGRSRGAGSGSADT